MLLRLHRYIIDLDSGEVSGGDAGARLAPRELELLRHLHDHAGRAVSREQILQQAFGYSAAARSRAVDKAMSSLRQKLEPDRDKPVHLRTVPGGYLLDPGPPRGARPPPPASRLVGRAQPLAELREALAQPGVVALTGPPGVGKSALAAEVLRGLPLAGAWGDLSAVSGPEQVPSAVAAGLGLAPTAPPEAVAGALAAAPTCLVLDPVDALGPPIAAHIAGWAEDAPTTRFLLVGQRSADGPDARVVRLGPLDPTESITLLRQEAAHAGHSLRHDGGLAELAAALGGLPGPLARAARRLDVFSAGALADRLRERPQAWLADLAAEIEAAWAGLAAEERDTAARLTVFEGAFETAAAEHVLGPGGATALAALVRASWLHRHTTATATATATGAGPRFVLLRPLRQRAAMHLAASARHHAEARHGQWYAEQSPASTLDDVPDLEVACARALARHDLDVAVATFRGLGKGLQPLPEGLVERLAEDLAGLPLTPEQGAWVHKLWGKALVRRGHLAEATERFHRAAHLAATAGDEILHLGCQSVLASARFRQGHAAEARDALGQVVADYHRLGRPDQAAMTLVGLGVVHQELGEMEQARCTLIEAQALLRTHVPRHEPIALNNLGMLADCDGRPVDARRHYAAALALFEAWPNPREEARVTANLAALELRHGDLAAAAPALGRADALAREVGDARLQGSVLGNLAAWQLAEGLLDEAETTYHQALALHVRTHNARSEAIARIGRGRVRLQLGRLPAAREDLSAGTAIADRLGERRIAALGHAFLAFWALAAGALAEARTWVQEAERRFEGLSDPLHGGLILLARAELDHRAGDPASARRLLAEAEGLLTSRGATVRGDLTRVRALLAGEPPAGASPDAGAR